eukprot:TRINITY_DN6850_c0_g1_i18.p1 TRINITY_DN6850_c0_g1~~TRINITY_DN6850_c0_g1_i18.p1  ORF type:complete len:132 (+),score=7.40 TRINITY_DN6850_c0_g1_i18:507-902(+)
MTVKPKRVGPFSLQQFRRFGILCCRRLAYLTKDRRLAKALTKLEQSLGPPMDERLRRDAFNAANSACSDISRRDGDMTIEAAVACTLVCACEGDANTNLLGNFEFALSKAESLTIDEIREIEYELSGRARG